MIPTDSLQDDHMTTTLLIPVTDGFVLKSNCYSLSKLSSDNRVLCYLKKSLAVARYIQLDWTRSLSISLLVVVVAMMGYRVIGKVRRSRGHSLTCRGWPLHSTPLLDMSTIGGQSKEGRQLRIVVVNIF